MTLPEAIEFMRPSVVQILVEVRLPPTQIAGGIQMPQRPQQAPLGTGFFVSADGYAITARHVIQAFRNIQTAGNKRLMVGVALPNLVNATLTVRGNFTLTECDVIDEDSRHDLALLKLKQNPLKGEVGAFMKVGDKVMDIPRRVATPSTARPQDGEAIAVSGYPFSSTVLVTTSGNLASSWSYETEEVQIPGAPAWFTRPDVADSYLGDIHVNPGNSGGPIYTVAEGKVIGVCVSFDMAPVVYGDGNHEPASTRNRPLYYNSGLANIVPLRYVTELLSKNNLKWETR